jgi:hypothetical protein
VIDSFDPGLLMSPYCHHLIDFATADEADLHDICIPLSFVCKGPSVIHGIACWFDVHFPGSFQSVTLSTAPGMAATHWYQLRCVLQVCSYALFTLNYNSTKASHKLIYLSFKRDYLQHLCNYKFEFKDDIHITHSKLMP